MDIKKIFKSKKIILLVIIFIVLIVGTIIFVNSRNDGMANVKGLNIYYKVYTKEKGFSKWYKNGLSNSNKNYNIKNIKIKLKDTDEYSFSIYNEDNGWVDGDNLKNQDINAIKVSLFGSMRKKYSVCYRVYNDKNKWLNWSCDNEINGNKEVNIKSIQMKLIPKNAVKNEYLKDYVDNNDRKNYNFE